MDCLKTPMIEAASYVIECLVEQNVDEVGVTADTNKYKSIADDVAGSTFCWIPNLVIV